MLASRGVDAHDPKASHVSFALTAMAVGMTKGLYEGLLGLPNEPMPPSTVALGQLKQSLVAVPCGHTALDPRHSSYSLIGAISKAGVYGSYVRR